MFDDHKEMREESLLPSNKETLLLDSCPNASIDTHNVPLNVPIYFD